MYKYKQTKIEVSISDKITDNTEGCLYYCPSIEILKYHLRLDQHLLDYVHRHGVPLHHPLGYSEK